MVQPVVPRFYCTAESPHRLMAGSLAQSSYSVGLGGV